MARGKPPFTVAYDERIRDFLVDNRIFLRWPREVDGVYRPGEEISIHAHIEVEPESTMPPRLFRTMGAYTACLTNDIPVTASIGRHSHIAAEVGVMGINHPIDWVTTHPLTFREYGKMLADRDFGKTFTTARFREVSSPVVIGHGVSIGRGALLRQGVTIGDGAVVQPGTIVTRDVAPYEIVSGIPGRSQGLRFSAEVVEKLLRSAWWDFTPMDLAHLPADDPLAFLDGLKRRVKRGIVRREPPKTIRLAVALKRYLAQGAVSQPAA